MLSSQCLGTGRDYKLWLLRRLNSPMQRMDVWFCTEGGPIIREPYLRTQILVRSTGALQSAPGDLVFSW